MTQTAVLSLMVGAAIGLTGCRTNSIGESSIARSTSADDVCPARDMGAPVANMARELPASIAVTPALGTPFGPRAWLAGGADAPAPAEVTPPAGEAPAGEAGGGDLAKKSADPTAPLMTLSINEWYSPGSHQLDEDEEWNTIMLRAVLPFKLGCQQHILRVSQPIYTDTPGGVTGIGDATFFDLLIFKGCGFTYGLGADLSVPWGEDGLSSEKWSGGPAGVLMVPTGKWMFGLLNQNYFSFAGDSDAPGVAQTIFQPIVVLGLGKGRTIGLSELAFVYDWNLEDWTSAPFGLSFAQVVKIGCQATKFSISADYNFIDTYVQPDWTLRFGVSFLFP